MIWIDVNEQKPEDRKDVLLYCAGSGEWERGWLDVSLDLFLVENTGRLEDVTHWAEVELPEVES